MKLTKHRNTFIEKHCPYKEDAKSWNFYGSLTAGIRSDEIVERLKKLLKRVGKMEQMEYSYMVWEDELKKILGEDNDNQ